MAEFRFLYSFIDQMEKEKHLKRIDSSNNRLLQMISSQLAQQELNCMKPLRKFDQFFGHRRQSKASKGSKVQEENRKISPVHLVKHQNKIETNAKQYWASKISKSSLSKGLIQEISKPQAIAQDYLTYFRPKSKMEIVHKQGQTGHFRETQVDEEKTLPVRESIQFERKQPKLDKINKTPLYQSQNIRLKVQSQSKLNTRNYQQSTFQKDEDEADFSCFTRKQLLCYYRSLLQFSSDGDRYAMGFETMLNLMNISASEKVINQCLSMFNRNPCFEQFISVYKNIIALALKENVTDYFEIVFDGHQGLMLGFQQLVKLLSERMTVDSAREIAEETFFLLCKECYHSVSLEEVLNLCYCNQYFCNLIRAFHRQPKK